MDDNEDGWGKASCHRMGNLMQMQEEIAEDEEVAILLAGHTSAKGSLSRTDKGS